MFSSKIIKMGDGESRPLALGPLEAVRLPDERSFFVALKLGTPLPATEPELGPEEPLPPPPEPPPTMTEAEALERAEEAYQEGVRTGRRDAEGELSTVSEALAKGLLDVAQLRKELLHDSEEDLLKLAVLVARRIILREISLDPGILAGMVQGAVELVSECDEVVVRLNPRDQGVVEQSREFAQLSNEKKRITLKPDPVVERGGCMVETVRGNVDARLESQLDEIYRRLAEERSTRRDDAVAPH